MEVNPSEYQARNEMYEDRFKRDNIRITNLETKMETLAGLVTELASIVKTSVEQSTRQEERYNDQAANHEDRIRALELKPAKRWDGVVGDVIKLLVAAAFGYFLSALPK